MANVVIGTSVPIILASLQIYFWIVVNSFYEQLKENERLSGLQANAAVARAEQAAEVAEKKAEVLEAAVEEGRVE